jgi:single-stranded-DNA-specific exonuclease
VRDADAARELLVGVEHVVPHTDADGLAAGALALRARGGGAGAALLLGRGETPFGTNPPLPPGSVAVLDWGVRPLERPGLLVDHHAPEVRPRPDQVVLTGYGERPETTTAALVRRLVPETPAWVAAVGAVGDLGSAGFALPECAGAPRTAVRRLVPLVNAPRRLARGPVLEALALLVEAADATAALADARVAALEEARRERRAELDRVRRVPPRVHDGFALIRFSSPAQVHPLVAAQWRVRLEPRVVLVANDGYLPGRVNFSVRGGGRDLRRWLREALPEARGEFAHGHDAATGGSLTPDDFDLLLQRLKRRASGVRPADGRAERR